MSHPVTLNASEQYIADLLLQSINLSEQVLKIVTPKGIEPMKPVKIIDVAKMFHKNAAALARKGKKCGLIIKVPGGGRANYIYEKDIQKLIA